MSAPSTPPREHGREHGRGPAVGVLVHGLVVAVVAVLVLLEATTRVRVDPGLLLPVVAVVVGVSLVVSSVVAGLRPGASGEGAEGARGTPGAVDGGPGLDAPSPAGGPVDGPTGPGSAG